MADKKETEIITGLAVKPWTTAFIAGDHECFPAPVSMPTAKRWGAESRYSVAKDDSETEET